MKTSGHHVLITGGGSGIGLALAKAYIGAGNSVIICGRKQARLDQACAAVPGVMAVQGDVTRTDALLADVAERTGGLEKLSVLVNNAGLGDPFSLLQEPDAAAKLELEIGVDLLAPIRLTDRLLPHLLKHAESAVINMSSGLALWPNAAVPGYSVSKAGLRAYSTVLRHQAKGRGLLVMEVQPPMVDTDMVKDSPVRKVPPAKVASAVLKAMRRNRGNLPIGVVRLMEPVGRLSPWLRDFIMQRYPFPLKDLDTLYR